MRRPEKVWDLLVVRGKGFFVVPRFGRQRCFVVQEFIEILHVLIHEVRRIEREGHCGVVDRRASFFLVELSMGQFARRRPLWTLMLLSMGGHGRRVTLVVVVAVGVPKSRSASVLSEKKPQDKANNGDDDETTRNAAGDDDNEFLVLIERHARSARKSNAGVEKNATVAWVPARGCLLFIRG